MPPSSQNGTDAKHNGAHVLFINSNVFQMIARRLFVARTYVFVWRAPAHVAVHSTFRMRASAKPKAAQSQQQIQEKWKLSVSSPSFLQFFLRSINIDVYDENAS